MKISVKNTSSPGAMFSENTNNVLLSIYEWILENNYPFVEFKQMRLILASEKGINDNNARNIYPLLRNCGFIRYVKNEVINTSYFFTNTGLAYAKLLKTEKLIHNDSSYSDSMKKSALHKIDETKANLIYKGLTELLRIESNYKEPFVDIISFLLMYKKINKKEFALLLFEKENGDPSFLENMSEKLFNFRNGFLSLDVDVDVRNDINVREMSGKQRRNEGLQYLTSFGYFVGLLTEAKLVTKNGDDYFVVIENKIHELELLLEE